MSLLLAIHSYPGANDTVRRHWPYYEKAGADKIVGIDVEGGGCWFPDGIESVRIGDGKYLNGPNLPTRLMETLRWLLTTDFDYYCIAEYDVLFFAPIPPFKGIGGHIAGGKTWNGKASYFAHTPWFADRVSAANLVLEMRQILAEGHCTYGSVESSPDCFFAYACERLGLPCQQLLSEFSRNAYDLPGDLELAREAYRSGVQVLHGVKEKHQLDFILG